MNWRDDKKKHWEHWICKGNTKILSYFFSRKKGGGDIHFVFNLQGLYDQIMSSLIFRQKCIWLPDFWKYGLASDRDSFLCCIRSQTINGIIDFVELSLIVALPIDRLPSQETNPCRLTSFSLFMICLHKHWVPVIFHIYMILHTYIVYHGLFIVISLQHEMIHAYLFVTDNNKVSRKDIQVGNRFYNFFLYSFNFNVIMYFNNRNMCIYSIYCTMAVIF